MNRITENLQEKVKSKHYQRFLPDNYRLEDIFLVSFPKSGNTWLRFLLANAIQQRFDLPRSVNFFSIHDIIPDVMLSRKIQASGIFGCTYLPRIIKSHADYNPYYSRAIVLVRDPRDTMVSYYYYLQNYGRALSASTSMAEFVRSERWGATAWAKHTASWLDVNRADQIVRFFRYEDLLQDTEKQLYLLLDLVGINLEPALLKSAIEACSKESMKRSEGQHMSIAWLDNEKTSFVRSSSASRKESLSDADREFIESVTGETAQRLGYQY